MGQCLQRTIPLFPPRRSQRLVRGLCSPRGARALVHVGSDGTPIEPVSPHRHHAIAASALVDLIASVCLLEDPGEGKGGKGKLG